MHLKIDRKVIFRHTETAKTYFHPKVALDRQSGQLVMTLQTIGGSDYFGPVQVSYSSDLGESWSPPEFIAPLGYRMLDEGTREGVCDVVPDYHAQSGKVLAIGHNVYYRQDGFLDTYGDFAKGKCDKTLQRYSVYSVRDDAGIWSERKRIHFEEFEDCSSFVCGCTQKVFLPDGRIIIPVSIGYWGRRDRMFCSILCDFDGHEITVLKRGGIIEFPADRGMLEPSLISFGGRFYLTLRAEDDHGYFSVSDDGLNWAPLKPWSWENGDTLAMSSTQQHWMEIGGRLYLVYTRDAGFNHHVIRWRAPLFIAELDHHAGCLKKETEQLVFPLRELYPGAEFTPMMGNFHPCSISPDEGIVTVGETIPSDYCAGDTLMACVTLRPVSEKSQKSVIDMAVV